MPVSQLVLLSQTKETQRYLSLWAQTRVREKVRLRMGVLTGGLMRGRARKALRQSVRDRKRAPVSNTGSLECRCVQGKGAPPCAPRYEER